MLYVRIRLANLYLGPSKRGRCASATPGRNDLYGHKCWLSRKDPHVKTRGTQPTTDAAEILAPVDTSSWTGSAAVRYEDGFGPRLILRLRLVSTTSFYIRFYFHVPLLATSRLKSGSTVLPCFWMHSLRIIGPGSGTRKGFSIGGVGPGRGVIFPPSDASERRCSRWRSPSAARAAQARLTVELRFRIGKMEAG